jgi:hypothetical protein
MSNKPLSHKIKWIVTGLFTGIFIATFLPEILLSNRIKTEQTDHIKKLQNKFAEYSQWPPFLTDSTFDLVEIRIILIKINYLILSLGIMA